MILRDETPADHAAIRHLVTEAFGQAGEAGLVDQLRLAGDAVISLVAEADGRIVGHILLSKMTAPFAALALAPLSVAPERQGGGIGSALTRAAVVRAQAQGWAAVFVLGDPAYYERFGFEAAVAAPYRSPYAGRHFMGLVLAPPLAATAGVLVHAPAFAALG